MSSIVADNIRKMIIEGEFELGQAISENMLAELYGISKTPIKLALVQLRSEGLVEIFPQKGSYVFNATVEDVHQLSEWRTATEVAALQAAYSRHKHTLLKDLDAIFGKMQEAFDRRALHESYRLDAKYHRSIVAASNNKYLVNSYDLNINKLNSLLFRFGSTPWKYVDRFEEHRIIIESLRIGKLHHAISILSVHIGYLCDTAMRLEDLLAQTVENARMCSGCKRNAG